jgi:2-keto-4-pentenoate hydratase/2-oxohepta-3-ene-1,7-dioic acid hydratase in catechol pathway
MARPAAAAPSPAASGAPARPPGPIPGIWQRKEGDTRHNPYLFLKSRSAVIADGETIRIPPGRDRIDWECELSVVVGRTASRVSVERAAEFIFGYTLQNDVSDRGGREDGRHGSDWLIGKSHDTFAPLGPFVVPREFVPDPQKLAIRFTLNGRVMQDSSTDRMTHSVAEVLSYASHIMTLSPGDVISTGSPAGVGTARSTPIYMKPGDVAVCSIERIGVLTNPVGAAGPPPADRGDRR